jgi:serine/threonine-protein kinase
MAGAMADSPAFVARFELEARSAAQIRSPHVVGIYEHGVHQGLPYMVMELLEGEDLNQRLKRRKRLSMIATAQIVRDMCKALQRAHEIGIVHRDIKPGNVFLSRDGDEEIVKVLDFGIAKLLQGGGGNMTATGEMIGTPSYMSPEHIQASKHVDHRADLWSVSVIAFRALTGQLPFTGQILDIVDGILKGAAPAPSTLAPDLSPAVDAFFARALARDINHRFQSARELSEALSKVGGRSSLVEPSGTPGGAVGPRDAATVAGAQPVVAPPEPPLAPEPPLSITADMKTEVFKKPGSQSAFNAAPLSDAGREPMMFNRTMPLDQERIRNARQALEAALAAAPPAAGDVARARSSDAGVAAAPRQISLLVWVALALVPVVIAAIVWAWMVLGK